MCSDNTDAITIDGSQIDIVNTMYLGVELDCSLSCDKHLRNVGNKASQKLYIFGKTRRFISQSTVILVYKQIIRPLLEYCNNYDSQ